MISRLDGMFRQQQRFAADASHELRTPLTAMRGEIDVALYRTRTPEEYEQVLAAMSSQVEHMTRLVNGLLMLARSDAGALPLTAESIDVGELIASVVEQVAPRAQAKGLTLTVDGDAPVLVEGDENLLLQLMLNLADNAVKFTATGGVRVGWRRGERTVDLFVRDTGRGVPDDQRERVFERFHRVDAVRSAEGAGLGLAICKWITEAHGGDISVADASPGSIFTVRLPLRFRAGSAAN